MVVGDRDAIQLPDFKRVRAGFRRFRGLRCIHTHLSPAGLSREDLVDLSLLRLDTMSVLEVLEDGSPGVIHTAHLNPDLRTDGASRLADVWRVLPACEVTRLDIDFQAFIRDLESEFARNTPLHWRQEGGEQAILVGVTGGRIDAEEERMKELAELAASAEVTVLDTIVQRRPHLDPRYLVGQGKLREIIIRGMQLGASLLIFNQNLSATQIRNICRETDLKVIDRTQLILDIFALRAKSQEGKIQVELAQLSYLRPRLGEFDDSLSRLTGGIGGRGPGETTLEVDRRHLKDRMALLNEKLKGIRDARARQRRRRQRQELPVVSIVGYTNAGKSCLLNALTRSTVPVEDKLFATLDPVSRRMSLPWSQEIILSDTVGFIRDLPDELVTAFMATLEEIEDSVLLVHLVDAVSSDRDMQIASVEQILNTLGLDHIPRIMVLNKVDQLSGDECAALARRHEARQVSALRGDGLPELVEQIRLNLRRNPAPGATENETL